MLIYSERVSTRLQYISKFILREQLGITVTLTTNLEGFESHDGPRINYSGRQNGGDFFKLENHPLLFENGISEQKVDCFLHNGSKAFFQTANSDFPFDIFAASFYLLSRYEEYLPHKQDMYGRYSHENSLAFREGFLNIPIVNSWIQDFGKALQNKFPDLNISMPAFSYTPTYDIDIAWSFKGKGLYRNIGGFLKAPSLERLSVLTRVKKDPYDCYEFLRDLHHEYKPDPIYFFLVATSRSKYDKNISPYEHNMWQLIKRHAKKYRVGLHPSWKSNENVELLKKEKKILETAGDQPVLRSRQHYIKFTLPETFNRLVEIGITEDYSMGYGSINGFRASVASSFYWYNLSTESVTPLRLFPFCFMDANSFFEQKQGAEESFEELQHYSEQCKKAGGQLVTIFHNNFLGASKKFDGWREGYVKFISQLQR
jgi:hypothetical protein